MRPGHDDYTESRRKREKSAADDGNAVDTSAKKAKTDDGAGCGNHPDGGTQSSNS